MEPVLDLTAQYFVLLLLALMIERFMEVLMSIFGYLEWKGKMYRWWNARARKLIDKLQSTASSQLVSGAVTMTGLGHRVRHYTAEREGVRSGNVIVISGKAVRNLFLTTFTRIVASVFGVILCMAADINLVQLILEDTGLQGQLGFLPSVGDPWYGFWTTVQLLASGIIIGLGSEPLHHLITNLERKREKRARREKAEIEAQKKPLTT